MFYLFAGINEANQPGMEAYIDHFDDIDAAIGVANHGDYQWAHIVKMNGRGLVMVNAGKWDNRQREMRWIGDRLILTYNQAILRTARDLLRSGLVLLSFSPYSEKRAYLKQIIDVADNDIQQCIEKPIEDNTRVMIYLARQLLSKVSDTINRAGLSRAKEKEQRQWNKLVDQFLKETRDIQFRIDVE